MEELQKLLLEFITIRKKVIEAGYIGDQIASLHFKQSRLKDIIKSNNLAFTVDDFNYADSNLKHELTTTLADDITLFSVLTDEEYQEFIK